MTDPSSRPMRTLTAEVRDAINSLAFDVQDILLQLLRHDRGEDLTLDGLGVVESAKLNYTDGRPTSVSMVLADDARIGGRRATTLLIYVEPPPAPERPADFDLKAWPTDAA